MFLRTIYFTVIVSLLSCSKNSTPAPLVGSVSFSVNGNLYSWSEQNSSSAPNFINMYIYPSTTGMYHFNASNEFSGNLLPLKKVFLTFLAASIITNTPLTYTNTTTVNPLYPPHQISVSTVAGNDLSNLYNASEIGDYATVIITGIHDNKIDGSFSARLSRASDLAKINITNGTFVNISINP